MALTNENDVIERILRHLRLWDPPVRVVPPRTPSVEEFTGPVFEAWLVDDPFPAYADDPVIMPSGD